MKVYNKNNIRQKKELGAFYTPLNLATQLTKDAIHSYLLGSIATKFNKKYISLDKFLSTASTKEICYLNTLLQDMTILDCSVGEGTFSITALQELTVIYSNIPTDYRKLTNNIDYILRNNLYGVDIDTVAVEQTKKNLLSFNEVNNEKELQSILKEKFFTKNFLDLSLEDFNLSNGFDIILGNPPWGSRIDNHLKEHYYNLYQIKSPKRNLNSFELFVYKTPHLLKKSNAILAYLLPKNIARSNQYTYLRKYILDHFKILLLSFFGLFKDVTQEFLAIVAYRSADQNTDHKIVVNKKNLIPQQSYFDNYDYIFTLEFDPNYQEIKKRMLNDSILLGDLVTIKRGEELSKRGGVMFCSNCKCWVQQSSRKSKITCPRCKIILQEENLKKAFLISNKPQGSTVQPLITGDDFEPYFIKSSHFIDPNFVYHSKKDPCIYRPPKLVVKKIAKYPCAAFDPKGHWTTQNVYNLRLKEPFTYNIQLLFYIIAILNSLMFKWYYEHNFNLKSNYTNAISIFNLKRLPIKNPNYNPKLTEKIVTTTKNVIFKHYNFDKGVELLNDLVLELYNIRNYSKYLQI